MRAQSLSTVRIPPSCVHTRTLDPSPPELARFTRDKLDLLSSHDRSYALRGRVRELRGDARVAIPRVPAPRSSLSVTCTIPTPRQIPKR